eukprot:10756531-Alexandrium_andersonii.AAC.1
MTAFVETMSIAGDLDEGDAEMTHHLAATLPVPWKFHDTYADTPGWRPGPPSEPGQSFASIPFSVSPSMKQEHSQRHSGTWPENPIAVISMTEGGQ